ncbi:EscR/YscR/HrcR family type III secretion system export apparatus protein [Lysobacter sp. BMK333-48F3]|uniref:EscR/YscR/HrcR family type III secretion system export apparatus protein n=1 Tax=Lysobacter sp. BMK333-48F3 TaxID=2867962 RepID=UPI00272E849D|nr:EscR/YscR/HrcR family type III secretion system export apparatus protein [Lysobacter sp. BMK333-48F3]
MDFSSFSPALVLVTVVSLALAPFVAVMVTSFTKIVVVLSLLRNALGLQQVPPNVVINGLAIVLSIYVMYPVILETHDAINARMSGQPAASATQGQPPGTGAPPAAAAATAAPTAAAPAGAAPAAVPAGTAAPAATAPGALAANTSVGFSTTATPVAAPPAAPAAAAGASKPPSALLSSGGKMDTARLLALMDAGKEPLRKFLIKHSSDAERAFFLRSAQRLLPPAARGDISVNDFIVVIPAFTVSELTAAFQIGFLIFLPFLIIDLVVSNILLSLGMMMLSPTTVSLPFKLLLFVLIGGWAKLVHGLVLTYGG